MREADEEAEERDRNKVGKTEVPSSTVAVLGAGCGTGDAQCWMRRRGGHVFQLKGSGCMTWARSDLLQCKEAGIVRTVTQT